MRGNFFYNNLRFAILMFALVLFVTMTRANAASVTLTATPTTNTVTVGQTANYTININRDGYADKIALSATGLPSGVTAVFTPNNTTGNSSILKLQTSTSTPIGIFTITIKGTANGPTIAPITIKLETKNIGSVSVSLSQESIAYNLAEQTTLDVTISRMNYDGPVTLSVSSVPSGMTVWFEPQTTSGNTSRMYIYSTRQSFSSNQFNMTVTAAPSALGIAKGLRLLKANVNCGIVWVEQFGTPDPMNGAVDICSHPTLGNIGCPDFATDVAFGNNGYAFLTGYIIKNVGGTNHDVWVAKYDTETGARVWINTMTSLSTNERPLDIAVDGAGNVYVAGVANINHFDTFIVKFNGSNGSQIGMPNRSFSTNEEDGTGGMVISFDGSGNPVLTAVREIIEQETYPFQNLPARSHSYDVHRYIFNSNLTIVTSQTPLVTNATGRPVDIAVGADGAVYVLGDGQDRLRQSNTVIDEYSWADKFINSSLVWREEFSAMNPSQGRQTFKAKRIAVDSNGNAILALTVTTVPPMGVQPTPQFSLLTKRNSGNGDHIWSIEDAISGEITALSVDTNNDVFYAGNTFTSLANFNPNAGEMTDMNARADAFFGKRLGANGNLVIRRQFSIKDKDGIEAIKANSAGNVLIAGHTVTFKNENFGYEDPLFLRYSLNFAAPVYFQPFVTSINPATVNIGTQFTITGGNFYDVSASPIGYNDNSILNSDSGAGILMSVQNNYFKLHSATRTQIVAEANRYGTVSVSYSGPVTIFQRCHEYTGGQSIRINQ